MFCIHCGKQINEGDRFCEFCGGQQTIVPEQAVQPQPAAQPVQQAVQPQPAAQPVQQAVQPQPQAVQPQQQVVYTTQPQVAGTQPQPQVVYVQQPTPQATPEPAPAPKKKKPPIALFVILGVLLTIGIIAAIIIAIVVFGVVKAGKLAKEKVADYGKTQMESYMEDNGFTPKTSESDNSEKDTGSGNTEDTTGGKDENGDIGQFGDGGDIGQFGDNTMTWESLDNPTLDDFNWIKAADTIYSDSSVKWLDSTQYQGAWKGMIIYSADGSEELVNFNLNVNSQNVTLLADWYMVHIGGNEMLPEDDVDDVLFTGYEWGSGIHVEAGTATIEIEEFWEIGGSQYAKGVVKLENAADSEVWLVRP